MKESSSIRRKDGKDRKVFDAPEWLAAVYSHIPSRGEQMVTYDRFFNTVRYYSSNGNPCLNSELKVADS